MTSAMLRAMYAEQPSDGIERAGCVQAGVGVHAAGDSAAVFCDGHAIPISLAGPDFLLNYLINLDLSLRIRAFAMR
jgi:hypothetical protein